MAEEASPVPVTAAGEDNSAGTSGTTTRPSTAKATTKGIVLNSTLDVSRPNQTPIRVVTFYQSSHRIPKYVGQEVGGLAQGRGKYTFKNGSVYEGEFENGLRHGNGRLTSAGGSGREGPSCYTGHWKFGRRHGFGLQVYCARTNSFYEGQWIQGRPTGWGRRSYPDGSVYEGGWLGGKREGVGVVVKPNGDCFEGLWRNDVREGPGRLFMAGRGVLMQGIWRRDSMRSGETTAAAVARPRSCTFAATQRLNQATMKAAPI